jgi:restriction endonuclease S subunit
MAVFNVIKLSELEGAKRLDAEYYKPEYLNIYSKLNAIGSKIFLKRLIKEIVSGSYVDSYFEKGTLYLRVNNITEFGFDLSDIKFVDVDFSKIPDKIKIKTGDLVLGRTGTIGITHLVDERLNGSVISQHITKIVIDENRVNKYYLVAYLNSNFARRQMIRASLGSMQVELTLDATKNLIIFLPSSDLQAKIGKLIQEFYELQRYSQNLYSQAESLLLEELGLKDFKPKYEKTYTAKLSDAFSAHRIDAEYFQPAYEEILRIVSKKYGLIPLKVIFDFRRGVFIPTNFYSEQKTGRPYIRIKELSGKLGIDESKIIFISDHYPNDEINQLQENDLVIAIIGDTIGKTNRLPKELAGGFCSNNTGRLRIKLGFKEKVLPEYAEILFQSIVIQSQIEKKKAQTGQPKISDNEMKSMKILLLPLSTQQKIASLVQQSYEARKKAKELLEVAKKAVEIAIEEGEEKAKIYLLNHRRKNELV